MTRFPTHLAWPSSKFKPKGNVKLLEDDVVSNRLTWSKEFELGEEINSHGLGRDQEDNVCHLEGDSMHSMTTNNEIFYDKYDKFKLDWRPIKNMTW